MWIIHETNVQQGRLVPRKHETAGGIAYAMVLDGKKSSMQRVPNV